MAYDTYYDSVTLLLHCDGTDASTTFTDNSRTPKTVTANGNAQIDTAQSQWGGASGLFDGTGDFLSIPDNSEFDPASGDFQIEFWIRPTSVTGVQNILGKRLTAGYGPYSILLNGTAINARYSTTGSAWVDTLISTTVLAINTWYFVTFGRSGTNMYLGVGASQEDLGTVSGSLMSNTAGIYIGGGSDGSSPFSGHLDDIRITKGIWRGINLPTEAFPDSAPPPLIYTKGMRSSYELPQMIVPQLQLYL